jgi:predicted RNA-binding Zn-ribbon protein involved in translation (DUF1610 family)
VRKLREIHHERSLNCVLDFGVRSLSSALIFGGETDTVHAGTLAGAGCFRCESCGYAVALHELDEVPPCPNCEGQDFRRSSIFAELALTEARGSTDEVPEWLPEARDALVSDGEYIAFEDGERVRVVSLQEGWTRIGRSLAAHIRFDDPTVSRRHALLHCESDAARILDDRSLNGVFVNGARVDMRQLRDGDQIAIGRFCLHFIRLGAGAEPVRPEAEPDRIHSAVG